MNKKSKKPEWAPSNGGEAFASNVIPGIPSGYDGIARDKKKFPANQNPSVKRSSLSTKEYVQGILSGNRMILGRAITLIESNSTSHMQEAQQVLKQLLPHSGHSIRIGISGVPGAGKSTLIEALGLYLIELGHQVAVLAIDPSSTKTGGSILGDKTRMEKLARSKQSFIRPSPSSGALGGVARKTRETIKICEAAGFDIILVETVGVGQSEVTVRSMVDFFILVQIAGGGDELQGIKKGVMEICDVLLVNKADGDNKSRAEHACQDYAMALHYMAPATPGWKTRAFTCSAITGNGIPQIWKISQKFHELTSKSGQFELRRREQARDWMHALLSEALQTLFETHPSVKKHLAKIEKEVMDGSMPATTAAIELLGEFNKSVIK